MTTSGSDPTKDIEHILACSICLETFKNPDTRPCSQTFCKVCLANKVLLRKHEDQQAFTCQKCGTFCKEEKYTNTFLATEVMDRHDKYSEKNMICFCCKKVAEWKCLDCKLDMCSDCQKVHASTPMSKEHKYQACSTKQVLSLDEVFYCELHKGQKLELHCVKCDKMICMTCSRTSHSTHKCENIKEANDKLVQKAKTKEQETFLCADIKQLRDKAVARYQVEKKFVTEKVRLAQEMIERSAKANHEQIQTAIDQNKAETKAMQSLIDTCETTLKNAKGCSLYKLLSEGLMQQLDDVKQKQLAVASMEISLPIFTPNPNIPEGFVFMKPPSFDESTRSFGPEPSEVRKMGLKFEDVMSKLGEKEGEMKLQHDPFRLGLVNDDIWMGSNINKSDFELLKMSNMELTQKSCDTLEFIKRFYMLANNEIIAACSTGLYSLNDKGEHQYMIQGGFFTDVCTEGEKLVALERNKRQVQVFQLTADKKWSKESEFTMKDENQRLKTMHIINNTVFVCYNWTHKIYAYSLKGDLLEEFGSEGKELGQFYAPFITGTDCRQSLIVCDAGNSRIQVRGVEGEWQQFTLRGITRVLDILVVKRRLFVLWGYPNNKKLTVYKINLLK